MYITRMINKDFVGPKNVKDMTIFYTFFTFRVLIRVTKIKIYYKM